MSKSIGVLPGAVVVGLCVALLVACGGAERDDASGVDGDDASGVDGDDASGVDDADASGVDGDDASGVDGDASTSTVLAAGARHSCWLLPTDGRVVCWGANDHALADYGSGQASPPPAIAFDVIAAADNSTCGIRRSDRQLECWGNAWSITNSVGVPLWARSDSMRVPLEALALGPQDTMCVIRRGDRQVDCTIEGPPEGVSFSAIAASLRGACAIRRDDGIAQCWGTAPQPPEGVAFQVIGGGGFQRGGTYCGIRRDEGDVLCWGDDREGQASPPDGLVVRQLSVGGSHACGIRAAGTVTCWGDDREGQASPPEGVAFDQIAAGAFHTCGVRSADGQVQCWGRDDHGQVSGAPSSRIFDRVAAGDGFACGLGADGALRCWGNDEHRAVSGAPEGVALETLSASWNHVCGVRRADGVAECWGRNDHGQASPPVGTSFETIVVDHIPPSALGTSERSHSCGIRRSDGHVVCWGDSESPDGVAFDVIAGECGLRREDGGVQCWGHATGTEDCRFQAGAQFSALTMTSYAEYFIEGCCSPAQALCGLASDGFVQCWGGGGECRDWGGWAAGMQFDSLAATHGGIDDAGFVCGISRSGGVHCSHAGYGHGSPPGGGDFSSIAVGRTHVCGIRRDGTLTCWGSRVWNPR